MSTARSIALKAIADGAASASGLVVFPLMASHVGAGGYGAYGQMNSVVSFIVPFASLGAGAAIVRFFAGPSLQPSTRRALLKVLLLVAVTGALAGAAVSAGGDAMNRAVLGWPSGAELFRWGGGLVAVGAVELVLVNFLQARRLFTQHALYQLAGTCLSLLLLTTLLLNDVGVVGITRALVLLKVVTTLGLLFLVLSIRTEPSTAASEVAVGFVTMMRYGLPLTVAGLGLWLMHLSDRFVIGRYMEPADVGRYGAVYTIVGLTAAATTPFFLPAHTRVMQATLTRDSAQLHQEIQLFHRYIALTIVCVSAALVVFSQPLVQVLGGADFHVGLGVVALLVLGLALVQWNGLANYILVANDRTFYMQNAWLVAGALNLVLNLVAVPRHGLAGAAAVTGGTFVLFCALVYATARRYAPLRSLYAWRTTLRSMLAAVLAAVPVTLILMRTEDSAAVLVAAALVFVGVTGLALVAFGELGRDDLATVRSIIRRTPLDEPVLG